MTDDFKSPGEEPPFERGRRALDEEDWVEAIRAFLEAVRAEPAHAESYLGLIGAYEAAADEYGDPELLDQATKVCRDARRLALDEDQTRRLDSAVERIASHLREQAES